ncbi:hypothetical protein RFI_11355 [Reticulomyxa filosa]|uniref:Uncharacterized protein n=1 Tax=Reticulomyxa filosa TaxID=46433 RepID=X6NHI0_RETFI|nr:hypothetical protein RFI_11355 [Reticulomyxa filosa]|eukprot:ETO25780.1 hypothetical protein RFI_11355 [Reticulomyxa filosa]
MLSTLCLSLSIKQLKFVFEILLQQIVGQRGGQQFTTTKKRVGFDFATKDKEDLSFFKKDLLNALSVLVLCPYHVYGIIRLQKYSNHLAVQKRYPKLLIPFCWILLVFNTFHIPYILVTLVLLNPEYKIPEYVIFFPYMIINFPALLLIFLRTYLLYYDAKYHQALVEMHFRNSLCFVYVLCDKSPKTLSFFFFKKKKKKKSERGQQCKCSIDIEYKCSVIDRGARGDEKELFLAKSPSFGEHKMVDATIVCSVCGIQHDYVGSGD